MSIKCGLYKILYIKLLQKQNITKKQKKYENCICNTGNQNAVQRKRCNCGLLSLRQNSPGLQVTKGKKCNGKKVDIIINPTEESILLKSSYNTTSNGRCDDLIIGPREGLYLIDKGSGYRFAAYRLVKYW